jgi:hypothetical protein
MSARDEDDATLMATIAALNARQFRTMLKFMAGGLHIDQACALIAARAGTGLELLADDVNTCVMAGRGAATPLPSRVKRSWPRTHCLRPPLPPPPPPAQRAVAVRLHHGAGGGAGGAVAAAQV